MTIEQARPLIKEALKIIEQSRFKYGTADFFSDFIDHWAYQQTGMYPPSSKMPEDMTQLSTSLSHVLAKAMQIAPTDDVFAPILCELGASKRGGNYFPTPPNVAQLMSAVTSTHDTTTSNNYYEPCCGTGVLALNWLNSKYQEHGVEGLKNVTIRLEDMDQLMVKCCFLQIINYLSNINGQIKELSIERMDSLSRKSMGLHYYATAAHNEPNHKATQTHQSEKQKAQAIA